MKDEKMKEQYEAPKAVLIPLAKGHCMLVSFSLEWGTDDIAEDDNEW